MAAAVLSATALLHCRQLMWSKGLLKSFFSLFKVVKQTFYCDHIRFLMSSSLHCVSLGLLMDTPLNGCLIPTSRFGFWHDDGAKKQQKMISHMR